MSRCSHGEQSRVGAVLEEGVSLTMTLKRLYRGYRVASYRGSSALQRGDGGTDGRGGSDRGVAPQLTRPWIGRSRRAHLAGQ